MIKGSKSLLAAYIAVTEGSKSVADGLTSLCRGISRRIVDLLPFVIRPQAKLLMILPILLGRKMELTKTTHAAEYLTLCKFWTSFLLSWQGSIQSLRLVIMCLGARLLKKGSDAKLYWHAETIHHPIFVFPFIS